MTETEEQRPRPAALVTGGRRGIGRAIAAALAGRGFDVVVTDIALEGIEECEAAVRGAGGGFAYLPGDVSEVGGHPGLVEAAWNAFGGLECLVNNAGVSVARRGDLLEADPLDFDRVMNVNLRGPYFLTVEVARRMLDAGGGRSPRSIINLGSINAIQASPDRGPYCISKLGVSMMTRLFALRLAGDGIAVHEVRPGVIRTDMTAVAQAAYDERIANGLVPAGRWGEPADIGRTVALLASGELGFSTGDTFHVDGGLHIGRL